MHGTHEQNFGLHIWDFDTENNQSLGNLRSGRAFNCKLKTYDIGRISSGIAGNRLAEFQAWTM